MAAHLYLVENHEAPAQPVTHELDVADVMRLLGQLAGPGPTSRAHLSERAAAAPTGAVERLRLVR